MSTKYNHKDAYIEWLLSVGVAAADISISRDVASRTINITIKI